MPSTVEIKVGGVDVSAYILYASARFESQHNAIPGTFEFTVKDVNHTFSFITGVECTAAIDGVLMYGGYALSIARMFPFPVMDTINVDPADVPRYFTLRGVDYNILFDKRVTRNPSDYFHQIPRFLGDVMDGDLIKQLADDYLDVTDVDTTTFVDNIRPPFNGTPDATRKGAWLQQGSTWRKQIEDWVQFTGALYYIDAAKKLHHHAIEDTVMRWGFSDVPNNGTITSPPGFQDVTIGPSALEAIESGEHMVNDDFIWGGSQWAGSGGTVFARATNTDSVAAHGLWQIAETHFGEDGYKLQEGVDTRADIIVNGPPGAVAADQNRGLRFPQWQFNISWFGDDVPKLSGTPDHLLPGYLSTIEMQTFEEGGDPLVQLLPLRQVVITFPGKTPTATYVKFEGVFGLQPDDPFTLWRFLLKNRPKVINPALTVVDNSVDGTLYGATGHFTPTPAPNGSATVFTLRFGYIVGTPRVYVNGALQLPGTDYTESDPILGQITFISPPASGSIIQVVTRTLSA